MSHQSLSSLPGFSDLAKRSNLTNSQLLIWLGQQLNPDSPLYNMAMRFDIYGAIDIETFENALGAVVGASDSMRSIIEVIDEIPQQRVLDHQVNPLEILDFSDGGDAGTRCSQEIASRTTKLFDLSNINFTTVLIKLGPAHFVWFFNQHHLFTDIKSIELIYKQVSRRYLDLTSALSAETNPDLPQFASYLESESQRSQNYENTNPPEGLEPVSLYHRKGNHRRTAAHRVEQSLTAPDLDRLKALAAKPGFATLSPELSLFNVVATAFCAYLHRISDSEALAIGAPVHNRATLELKNTIGLFIEVHPFLVAVDQEDTFTSLHEKVTHAAFEHLKLAASSKSEINAARGYNVVLNYLNAEFTDFGNIPCHTDWLHNHHIDPQHDLRLQVMDLNGKGQIKICFDFNAGLMNQEQGSSALSHFMRVLDRLLSDPDQKISTVSLAGKAEQETLIKQFANVESSCTTPVNESKADTVLSRFKHHVKTSPNAVAVFNENAQISYLRLDQLSDALANRIMSQVGAQEQIGVCAARSVELLVAILAVHKSGAAFVPLDPAYPDARLHQISESAEIRLTLCDAAQQKRLTEICQSVMQVDLEEGSSTQAPSMALPNVEPKDNAYIIFTSGSTGIPKGVVVQHHALADYVDWAGQKYCGELDEMFTGADDGPAPVFPLYSSIGFDLTITSLFVPLTLGGAIRLYPEEKGGLDLSIIKVVQDNAVDVIKLTPAHLSLLAGMNLKNSRTHTLILGGEDLTTAVAQQAQRLFRSNIRIFNEYGPTEAVVGCMIHRYRPETDKGSSVPIGKPADGVNIYLLDAGGNPVPQGVTGEIWIGGRRLAAGYKNQPELTEQRFLPDPFLGSGRMYRTGDLARTSESNQLLFLGRKDTQLKIRGVRIETAEISNAVKSHPLVSDCHVMALQPSERVDHQPVHYCTTCGLASNYPGVSFNQNGKCNHCQDFDSYRDLAAGYFRSMPQLKKLLHNMSLSKRGNYDLLMLLSGGKDSTYALYQVCAMGLKVFAMTLDNGYISEGAKANIRRSVADLDIEHEFVTTDAMNAIFSDSLNRHSSVCYGCFKTIYTLAINHAHQRGIPVIVTGLSRGQMFETRLTKQVFEQSEFDPDLIDREVLETRKVYHRIPDKVTECVDMSLFASDDIFNEIQFVDFYRYCDVSMEEMYAFLEQHAPWTRPADTGRSTNCLINDTGIYVHKNKLGYHNYALPYSWDVRLGHKQRDAALEELNDQIDAGRVHEILQEIDYRDTDLTEGADHKKLVAYYSGSELVGIEEMRSYLRARLPEAMIPSYYVHLGSIPLTANGKIDQDALPDPRNERPKLDQAVIPANTDTEKILAKIWREALRINQVGIYDNFFDLGGDSIIAIQIVVRASEEGISMTPNQLFLHQTIHELAAASVIQDSENKSQQTDDDAPFSLLNQDDDVIKNLSTLLDT